MKKEERRRKEKREKWKQLIIKFCVYSNDDVFLFVTLLCPLRTIGALILGRSERSARNTLHRTGCNTGGFLSSRARRTAVRVSCIAPFLMETDHSRLLLFHEICIGLACNYYCPGAPDTGTRDFSGQTGNAVQLYFTSST